MIHPNKEGTGGDLYEVDTIYTAVDEEGKAAFVTPLEVANWDIDWRWAVATQTPAGVDWIRGSARTKKAAFDAAKTHLKGEVKFERTRETPDARW